MNEIFECIKDFLSMLLMLGIGIIALFLTVIFLVFPFCNTCYKGEKVFEYEDLNGNIGTAYQCQYSDADYHYKKGGQGQPICFVGNKIVAVKWYEDKTHYMNCFKSLWVGEE